MYMVIEVAFAAGVALSDLEHHHPDARSRCRCCPCSPPSGCSSPRSSGRSPKIPTHYHVSWWAPRPQGHSSDGHVVHAHWVGGFNINLQMVYGFFNPLGPVIDGARETMLLGHAPQLEPGRHRRPRGVPLRGHRLSDLQAPGGALCRHCLMGRSRSRTSGRSSAPTRPSRSSTTS